MFNTLKRWLGIGEAPPRARRPQTPAAFAAGLLALGALAAAGQRPAGDDEVAAQIAGVPVHQWFTMVKDVKFVRVSNAAAAGTSDIDSSRVDMTGYDSVLFCWLLGDVADTATLQAIAKSNAADSTSGSTTEKSGTAITAGAADYDNKLLIVDLHRPTLRYAYSTLDRGTANAVVDGCIAILYNSHARAVTQDSSVGDAVVGGPNA